MVRSSGRRGARPVRSVLVRCALTILAVAGAAVAPAPSAGPAQAGAQPLNQAAVIVETGAGTWRTVIRFPQESVSGIEALRLAGAEPVTYGFGGLGTAVCALYGVGRPAGPNCLGGTDGDPRYWAYFRAPAGTASFQYSPIGAGATSVRDGDVEGWRWGTGQAPAYRSLPALATPTVSVGDVTVPEGDGDPRAARVTLTLSRPRATDTEVVVTTTDGSALAGVDYRARTDRVRTIRAGRVRASFAVPILGNTTVQPNRTLTVTVTSTSPGVQLGRATGTVTILDDDGWASGAFGVGDARVVRSEEPGTLTVVRVPVARRGPATGPATVTATVTPTGALDGRDVIVPPPRVLTYEPGRRTRWVTLQIPASGLISERTATVSLSAPSGAGIGRGTGVVTVGGRP